VKRICVIGSLNVDIVTAVEKFPKPGESVFGKTFDIFIGGGKGANQASSIGRLSADVMMVGKIGDMFYGPDYLKVLKENNVDCSAIKVEKGVYPGIGLVAVDKDGENSIVVYPGANSLVDVELINENWQEISKRDIFLFQLEIPAEVNVFAMKKLREMGKTIIFDPAPAKEFPPEIYEYIDYITPNETELEALTKTQINGEKDVEIAARKLIERGAKTVIAKSGKKGAFIVDKEKFIHVKGYEVKAIDPTAAGDSFNGGFAYALSQGKDIYDSVRFAHAVAGLSTTAMGAQSAMPTIEEVEQFLAKQA
jgi:ribokinase